MIVRIHTNRGFIPTALYSDMRSAWNPAHEVIWRKIDDNLFTIRFGCVANWTKAMIWGLRLFRYQAVIIEEYDGFANPSSVILNKLPVLASVLHLPDNYLHDVVIRGMGRPIGGVGGGGLEVQIKLLAGYVGKFVGVRAKIDVTTKFVCFISIMKESKRYGIRSSMKSHRPFVGTVGF